MKFWLALALVLSVLTTPGNARACASCGAGDPTLTLAGTEQPFAGRLRVSLSTTSAGTASSDERTSDHRVTAGVAWAPWAWLMLTASVPLVLRDVTGTGAERQSAVGPGDLDLRARFVVLRDRVFRPTHLVTLQIGARFPLSPAVSDARGVALDDGAQTASATVTPTVGLAWSIYAAPFSLQSYALFSVPTRGGDGAGGAVELRAASLAIVQVVPALSLVIGPETRARMDPSGESGGAAVFATLGAMLGGGDITPYLLVRVPVVSSFGDQHSELLSLELGAALDT